ncbi:hypothetical protein J5N97_002489 [Dioscorea zingiberensis]|uniref:Myb-like domain-containing protein n=1 Tax=Dioscorea zingiberensis TaxID=325984 RepID=A0A9D5D2X6_9LILI|nr:hypothetical protein J5N97_002489 [Dioscorea zingiberensis]
MGQTQQACIVQALPAITAAGTATPTKQNNRKIAQYLRHSSRMEQTQLPCIVQALPATATTDKCTTTKQDTANSKDCDTPSQWDASIIQTPSCSRRTRSQAAPDWTQQEMLILVNEIAALDEGWLKSLSSYQRWKIVSDNCAASDVIRSSNQCKQRWELLLADYRKIRKWESRSRGSSYWSLDGDQRKDFSLPLFFDNQVFDSMNAVIKAQEVQTGLNDSDSEDHIIATDAVEQQMDVDTDSGSEEETWSKTDEKSRDKAQEMASKLEDNAKWIHAILRGELEGMSETELARQQAAELIKAFGDLTGTLDEFIDLIKSGEFEGIRACNSMIP